jgi:hypothetical protein
MHFNFSWAGAGDSFTVDGLYTENQKDSAYVSVPTYIAAGMLPVHSNRNLSLASLSRPFLGCYVGGR